MIENDKPPMIVLGKKQKWSDSISVNENKTI